MHIHSNKTCEIRHTEFSPYHSSFACCNELDSKLVILVLHEITTTCSNYIKN